MSLFIWLSCVTSISLNNKTKLHDDKAEQKQALKERIQKIILAQNRIIDSLIQAKDPRLKKQATS